MKMPQRDAVNGRSVTLYEPPAASFPRRCRNRYAVGSQTPGLTRNPDGSLDILIRADEPKRLATNWLPAPAGTFSLTFRACLPTPALLDGPWHVPPLTEAP